LFLSFGKNGKILSNSCKGVHGSHKQWRGNNE
jgi:hypothetical protein